MPEDFLNNDPAVHPQQHSFSPFDFTTELPSRNMQTSQLRQFSKCALNMNFFHNRDWTKISHCNLAKSALAKTDPVFSPEAGDV